jgi:RHS repeat-associated protein
MVTLQANGLTTSSFSAKAFTTGIGTDTGTFTVSRSGTLSAVTINLTVSGTAVAGVDYVAFPTNITLAANVASSNLTVKLQSGVTLSTAKTVVLGISTNASYILGLDTNAVITLIPVSDVTNSVSSPVGRYWRGSGNDPTFWSQVVPLSYETGTVYSNMFGNVSNLYNITSWIGNTLYHYNATNTLSQTNIANRIPFNNPIVAFGERVGGTPLYLNQPYSFGVFAGAPVYPGPDMYIVVFNRTNISVAGYIVLYPPATGTPPWTNFVNNGFQVTKSTNFLSDGVTVTTNTFGLATTITTSPFMSWGASYGVGYELTHTANNQATNYYYLVSATGYANSTNPMSIDSTRAVNYSLLYTFEFEQRPPWRSVFLDQPHFDGSPLPPFYAGKTVAEIMTNTPAVTNVVNFTPSAATNLDDSPELRRHPILDNFVASMGNDPMALANYVINQIDLTDPMDFSDNGNVAEQAVNPTGVSRGALGTFLEKQGSPVEQCALLVYLLRQAGVPAVYEFPPRNGLKILDTRLSRMLKFQVHGAYSEAGNLYTTNTMITVNYPWVAAYIGTNWVHIFPWLKDYDMTEGLNLWEEMPTNYPNAYLWLHDYLFNTTNLLSLAVDGDSTPRVIFPKFLQQTLLANHPGVSVNDIGMQAINRQHNFSRWQDFPTPTWVTNTSTSLESLTSSAITNISPTLTNIFDTVSVEIYSVTNPATDIQSGDMRLCDLHNREFYVNQFVTNSNVQLNLILMPFRPGITNQSAFSNDTNLLSKELLSLTLGSTDDSLSIRFRYHRHRALSAAYAVDPFSAFLGLESEDEADFERPLRKGDQAAICMDYGRVTRDMLNVHAADIWQMENALRTNSAFTNSVSPDVYQGATIYLAGMSYYEKVGEFDQLDQNLHKIINLSTWAAGLSKVEPARNSSGNLLNGKIDPVLPAVDMFHFQIAWVGNGTARLDSGQDSAIAGQNYNLISIADSSAQEHQVINRFYQQTNAVSTVRLLQIAQSKGLGIVQLNISNYVAQGSTLYQGHALNSYDPALWQQTTNIFQSQGSFNFVYMTPGPITNSSYKGMASLILGWGQQGALISPNSLNGGFGDYLLSGTFSPVNTTYFDLYDFNDDFSMALNLPTSGATLAPDNVANFDFQNVYNGIVNNSYTLDGYDTLWSSDANSQYGLTSSGSPSTIDAAAFQFTQQSGDLGKPTDSGSTFWSVILDPVHTVTGEFYVNETDLQLPGPMPLTLSRHYSSQNLADNQFGAGWKLNIMPYLVVSTGGTNIFAADLDGAVLAYIRTATNSSVWLPTPAANPQLNNDATAGVGSLFNRLRARIVLTGTTNYTLYAADGSVRTFQTMTFNNGVLNQTRPYLQKWTDNRGNYYNFVYGTDSTQPNFGEVIRIQSSNGNFLGLDYDIYAHIIDAYTGDGRWLYYNYDEYGDLVMVTLPDSTTRSYQYLHGTQAVTNGSAFYSTHLIIEEDKPDGRALINAYDNQRRVTNQLSTAGADLTPIRTGTFIYSNNFNVTNSFTNAVSGFTLIVDGNGHTNRYDYTNSLITKITDPVGQTIQQTWYADNATAPGYPRSVATRTDKRGLVTQYQYDGNGNVTNTIITGDITGDGITSQTATNTAIYNTNSLPVQITDAAGNSTVVVYDSTFNFLPQQVVRYAGATPVSTNYMIYGNATNIVVNGNITQTNNAFGILTRQIRAYGSPDAATNDLTYDGHGFVTQSIRYTGTGDPNVIKNYFYNERGDQVSVVDSLGAVTFSDYDALDRPIEKENFDEFGNPLAWNFYYYNDNGEINWIDGPRNNPEDYIFYDYDGAGRPTTEIHWRSEVSRSGTHVEAPSGYNLYAQTFYQYDPLGNLTLKVDPRGAMTTNIYNALCQVVQRKHIDVDGTTVLSVEGYAYEAGGQESFCTNALGGITATLYTITGKPEYRSKPDGSTNGWRYYFDGRIKREIQSNGAYWQTTYDDVNLITTRIFYSAAGNPLATNSMQFDRRGNVIQKMDAGGNAFTTAYDGLDRVKSDAGPITISVIGGGGIGFPGGGSLVTNVFQQAITNFYDAAGRVVTNINALGEMTVAKSDAIGRPVSTQIFSASGALVRENYMAYSPDHNSVTVTNGSGATAVVTTTVTDNDGHIIGSFLYPSTNIVDSTFNQYDLSGNFNYQDRDSDPFNTNDWHGLFYVYDGLNRLTYKYDRDNAITTNSYDAMGDLTNRAMPGGLTWQASFNNAGQMLQEKFAGGGAATRTNNYAYFSSGNAFAGLLQTKTDGRGVSCAYAYDDFLRPSTMTYSGSLPEQNLTTTWQYEPRGFATSITEQFASTNTGPATSVQRAFDPYGQLASESVSAGSFSYGTSQSFDAAGRRTGLGIGSGGYSFGWQADGNLTSVSDSTGSGSYSFDTAGLLTTRLVGGRMTSITSRDGEGRPLSIATTVNTVSQLTESLSWGGDGLMSADSLARADFTDSRSYTYAYLSRRLIQEQQNLNASTRWTNTLVYDNGTSLGIGLLTQMGQATGTSNKWNGVADAFSRVNTETNNTFQYPAYGHANGPATFNAWLDSQPMPVTAVGTQAIQWRASMELTPGAHQLTVSATHPSGQYTAWATNSFTNNIAYQTTADTFDPAGNITQRIWKNPNGTTNRTQTLSWDARQRLHKVSERDANNSGYDWTATFDALNRRLQTTTVLVTNGVASTAPPQNINSYYDPQVRFLELGVQYGLQSVWKLYGPDLNGKYGGLQGTGGFEGVSPGLAQFIPTISDGRGNVLAEVTNGVTVWSPSRPTGYGAVPDYRPVALANGADIAQSSAWRGRWVDITGYYQLGNRLYDPISGQWLSSDSVWNDRDPNCYTFAGDDPINYFDPDGKIARDIYTGIAGTLNSAISIAISPLVFLEGTVRGLESHAFGDSDKPYTFGFTAAAATIVAGVDSYGRAYDVAQQATGFLQVFELLGHQLPVIGNFIPGPQGATSGDIFATFTSRGIYGVSQSSVTSQDNRDWSQLQSKYQLAGDQSSAPYVGGTITEVISELLFGNTSRGLEYASQVIDSLSEMGFDSAGMINQIDHSGGVIRGLEGSTYLGYYGIGVANNFSSQGPALGYFNNVQNLSWNLSPSSYFFGEPTSTVSWLLSPGLIGTTPNVGWDNGPHVQPGSPGGSAWDNNLGQFLPHN